MRSRASRGSRGPRRNGRYSRSRSAGAEDPPIITPPDDGSLELENFLASGPYVRVTAAELCDPNAPQVNPMDLTVYRHKNGVWSKLDLTEILKIWQTAQITQQSFCTILKKNLFKLRGPQRTSLTRALTHANSADSIGFYAGPENKYVLVVRLPVDYKTASRMALGLGGAGGVGAHMYSGWKGKDVANLLGGTNMTGSENREKWSKTEKFVPGTTKHKLEGIAETFLGRPRE